MWKRSPSSGLPAHGIRMHKTDKATTTTPCRQRRKYLAGWAGTGNAQTKCELGRQQSHCAIQNIQIRWLSMATRPQYIEKNITLKLSDVNMWLGWFYRLQKTNLNQHTRILCSIHFWLNYMCERERYNVINIIVNININWANVLYQNK